MDDGSPDEQWLRIESFVELSGLIPGFIIGSGSKSWHPHWMLSLAVPIAQRTFFGRWVAIALLGDPAVTNSVQAMRVPGFYRKDKGKEQPLEFHSDAQYTPAQLEAGLKKYCAAMGFTWRDQQDFSEERWRKIRKVLVASGITTEEKRERLALALQAEESPAYTQRSQPRGFSSTKPVTGSILPLEKFLSRSNQELVELGQTQGDRHPAGFRLAMDLLGAAAACARLGIHTEGDPRQMLDDFAAKCSPPLIERDIQHIWDSANRRSPTAAIGDDQIVARASYLNPEAYKQQSSQPAQPQVEGEAAAATDGKLQWLAGYKERVQRTQEAMRSIARFRPVKQSTQWITLLVDEFMKRSTESEAPLPPALPNLEEAVYGLRSGMGSGKSVTIREVVSTFASGNLLVHRNSIAMQTCQKINEKEPGRIQFLWDIREIKNPRERQEAQHSADQGWQAGCVESLAEFTPKDVLVLEEVESLQKSLLTSSTCRRGRRERLRLFKIFLRAAKYIFIADASLSGIVLRWLEALAPGKKFNIVDNITKRFGWDCYFYCGASETNAEGEIKLKPNDKANFEFALLNEFARGKKLLLAADSQRWCESIERTLKMVNPQARGLRVDSTTKVSEDPKIKQQVKEFLEDPNRWIEDNKPDYVIYSPTAEASLDISIQDYFDSVFGNFVHVTFLSCKQMLGRLRTNCPRHIFCKTHVGHDDQGCNSPLPQVVAKHMLRHNFETISEIVLDQYPEILDDAGLIQKINDLLDPESGEYRDPHIQALVELKAQENYSRGDLRNLLAEELKNAGHIIHWLAPDDKGLTCPSSAHRKEIILKLGVAIAKAETITLEQAERIRSTNDATVSQRNAATKAFVQARLPGYELHPGFLVDFYINDRNWITRQETRYLLDNPEMAALFDRNAWSYSLRSEEAWWDVRSYSLKLKALLTLGIPQIAKKEDPWGKDSQIVKDFKQTALLNKDLVKLALNITVNEDSDGCYLLRRCLGMAGYPTRGWQRRCKEEGRQGERERVYRVNRAVLAEVGVFADVYQAIAKRFEEKAAKLNRDVTESQAKLDLIKKTAVCDNFYPFQPPGVSEEGARPLALGDWVIIDQPETPHHGQMAQISLIVGNFLKVTFNKNGIEEVTVLVWECRRYQEVARNTA